MAKSTVRRLRAVAAVVVGGMRGAAEPVSAGGVVASVESGRAPPGSGCCGGVASSPGRASPSLVVEAASRTARPSLGVVVVVEGAPPVGRLGVPAG